MVRTTGSALLGGALCLLAGCASWESYVPYVVEIKDIQALTRDLAICQDYARNYHQGFDLPSVGMAAVIGAISNIPAAAISTSVIALGAGENATTALINGLNLLPENQRRVVVRCLAHKGDSSGLYLVLDPEA